MTSFPSSAPSSPWSAPATPATKSSPNMRGDANLSIIQEVYSALHKAMGLNLADGDYTLVVRRTEVKVCVKGGRITRLDEGD